MEEVKIQIIFTIDTAYGTFSDALYLTESEWGSSSADEIQGMKISRLNKWLAIISAPQAEPTKSQKLSLIQTQIDGVSLRLQQLQDKKAELSG